MSGTWVHYRSHSLGARDAGYNISMRSFTRGVAIQLGSDAGGVALSDLRALADDLERAGIDALVLSCEPGVEPITAAASLARITDLVLIPVISTAQRRSAAIVAKRATTLALLAQARVALVFRAATAADDALVLESVRVASALDSDGPIDFAGATVRLQAAYNEPRPDPTLRLAIGAWSVDPSPSLCEAAELVLVPASVAMARRESLLAAKLVAVVTVAELDEGLFEAGRPFVLDVGAGDANTVRATVLRAR